MLRQRIRLPIGHVFAMHGIANVNKTPIGFSPPCSAKSDNSD